MFSRLHEKIFRNAKTMLLPAVAFLSLGIVTATFSSEVQNQTQPNRAIEESPATSDIEPILTQHKLPGMAAAVLRGNRVVALGAAGIRRRGSPEKITIRDRFHLGSCTKAMTATLCAMLVACNQGGNEAQNACNAATQKLIRKFL